MGSLAFIAMFSVMVHLLCQRTFFGGRSLFFFLLTIKDGGALIFPFLSAHNKQSDRCIFSDVTRKKCDRESCLLREMYYLVWTQVKSLKLILYQIDTRQTVTWLVFARKIASFRCIDFSS